MRFLVLDRGLLARDCAGILRRMGHEVSCPPPGRGSLPSALPAAEALFSFGLDPVLARTAARRRIPYAAWVLEEEAPAVEPSAFTWIFCGDEALADLHRERGHPHVETLPTGAAPAFCVPGEASEEVPVGFVGSPLPDPARDFGPLRRSLEAQAAAGGEGARAAEAVLEVAGLCLAAQREDLSRFRIREDLEALERAWGVRLVDEGWTEEKRAFVLSLGEEAAREQRLDVCRAAAPLGLGVWGPPEWTGFLEEGMRYEGPAPWPGGAREACLRSAVSLHATPVHAGEAVPQRVWDVLACGGFLLTDERPGTRRLLGDALPAYRTAAEAASLARHFLERPDEREALAAHLREEVLARHTLGHRISHLLGRIAASV